jgi:cyclophilin family peptidyl-prolyl cis-trans isomerase
MIPRRLACLALALALAACGTPSPTPGTCPTAAPTPAEADAALADAGRAVVTTNKGTFTIELDTESTPIAAANFVLLARCGFYDGLTFHRLIPGFVAQAGDPQTRSNRGDFDGLGSGGPGYRFDIEFPPTTTNYEQHMVALANALDYDQVTGEIRSGPDTNGSQFFVMLGDAPELRPYYSLLGRVTEGTQTLEVIGSVPTSGSPREVPLDPVIIETLRIEPPQDAS